MTRVVGSGLASKPGTLRGDSYGCAGDHGTGFVGNGARKTRARLTVEPRGAQGHHNGTIEYGQQPFRTRHCDLPFGGLPQERKRPLPFPREKLEVLSTADSAYKLRVPG